MSSFRAVDVRLIIGGPTASPSKLNISAQTCRMPKQIRLHLHQHIKFDYIAWANLAANRAKISTISDVFKILRAARARSWMWRNQYIFTIPHTALHGVGQHQAINYRRIWYAVSPRVRWYCQYVLITSRPRSCPSSSKYFENIWNCGDFGSVRR
jgi:hypothetical protein